VRAAAHARLVTTATFLARAKLAAMEDGIVADGFTDSDEEDGATSATRVPAVPLVIDHRARGAAHGRRAEGAGGGRAADAGGHHGTSTNPMMALAGAWAAS
jgi:hypothetical protein